MKRSTQVGLVLMSALGVGGTAYMLMPGRDCRPAEPADTPALHAPLTPGAAAVQPQAQPQNCAPRGSSGSSGSGRWSSSGSSWWHGSSSSSSSGQTGPVVAKAASGTASSTASSSSGIGSTIRSGFGSFARAMSSGG